jgi:Ethanolamine utilization protein EutJ (predicted chaperonin)
MMDIVERLHREIGGYTDVDLEKAETDMREAANEIERLREENERLQKTLQAVKHYLDNPAHYDVYLDGIIERVLGEKE